jgi:redox-sensitive bicupin YhaK (pirin superfamily)
MNTSRSAVLKFVPSAAISEGAGVQVRRTIGTAALRHLDPFLMLDHFVSENPNDYIAGFPDHPHRGFITFTYMLNGKMLHRDSMGNRGELISGAAQWMKAASGIIHSEMPQQKEGLMRGFQLWINLPAAQKMSAPEYQEFGPDAFPVVQTEQGTVKVLVGEYAGTKAPISDTNTRITYLDVTLKKGATFEATLLGSQTGFVYPFEGSLSANSEQIPHHSLAVLDFKSGDVTLTANSGNARFIFVAGTPIGEPIVQHGPFVMNTRAEIEAAFADYENGTLVKEKALL